MFISCGLVTIDRATGTIKNGLNNINAMGSFLILLAVFGWAPHNLGKDCTKHILIICPVKRT